MSLEPPAALAAAEVTFTLSDTQGETRNPFDRTSEVFDWEAGIWMAEVRFARRHDLEGAAVRGFLAKLRGMKESFWLGDPAAAAPQGTQVADFVLAAGASPGDRSLSVTMGASATLKSGDYVQLGSRLHLLTDDVTADGLGAATLPVWPEVREPQALGATVKSSNARGLWRLAEPDRKFSVRGVRRYSTALELIEAI